ncbi:MAG: SRPBCC domain-containing protein [Candidatus Aenigmarchaeota archaeon]|nr:SRPBCC domain-containing protein [Candidatus Aenigmarchaeota archaeon]
MVKTKTIRQSVAFRASPHQVYEALMDSKKHSKFTGSRAVVSRRAGGKFTAYGGGLRGSNIELVPDRRIVQSWMCIMDNWPKGHYSKVTISLKETKTGTKLTLVHSGVPERHCNSIRKGWKDHYWTPMKKMLE